MPLLRLIAEGVGPFERLDLRFSDGHGNPHLGPHILAGVNGSGKSTALRAIAWPMDWGRYGFNHEEWRHFLAGHSQSQALLILKPPHGLPLAYVCSRHEPGSAEPLIQWARKVAAPEFEFGPRALNEFRSADGCWVHLGNPEPPGFWVNPGAYAPSPSLEHVDRPDPANLLPHPFDNCLAFRSTVDNGRIHAWLVGLHARKAIARERGEPTDAYERSLERFGDALMLVCGRDVHIWAAHVPALQLRVDAFGQSLNFSQLPDGMRNTVGWLADFMMRQDRADWTPTLAGKRPGILLLDEVDAHLHPRWQRTLLPAMRAALPDVQIIVTTHSPFVISSCAGARVHVLELDERTGRAHARKPEDVPLGQSVVATLKDIFGVASRFDVQTEKELEEWNDLLRQEAVGKLSRSETVRLDALTTELSRRSEELRYIVAVRQPPGRNSRSKPSKARQRKAG